MTHVPSFFDYRTLSLVYPLLLPKTTSALREHVGVAFLAVLERKETSEVASVLFVELLTSAFCSP